MHLAQLYVSEMLCLQSDTILCKVESVSRSVSLDLDCSFCREGIKIARKIAETDAMKRVTSSEMHPGNNIQVSLVTSMHAFPEASEYYPSTSTLEVPWTKAARHAHDLQ